MSKLLPDITIIKTRLLLMLMTLYPGIFVNSQTAVIRNVDFSLSGNTFVITYDIANSKENDKFNIKADIFKSSGEKINARSFRGDLNGVTTTHGNRIIWEIEKDNISLNDEIYVVVSGEVLREPIPVSPRLKYDSGGPKPVVSQNKEKNMSRALCLAESLLFPGWGTSKLSGQDGHLIKGFLGYSMLVGSIVTGIMASDNYESYRNAVNTSERDKKFEQAERLNSLSLVLAAGTAIVWTVELVSVLSIKDKSTTGRFSTTTLKISYYHASGNINQLGCKINF